MRPYWLDEIYFPIEEEKVFSFQKLAHAVGERSCVSGTKSQQLLLNNLLELSKISENWRSN